jgi:transcriptional regulator with XRE-family HTH domain
MHDCIGLAPALVGPEYAWMHTPGGKGPRSALDALMNDRGLSDNELARHLRLRGATTRQSTITRIRSGKTRHPDEVTVRFLADYFDVSPEQIRDLAALQAGSTKKRPTVGKAVGLSDQALELARLWMSLPTFKQTGYLQAITVDAAVAKVFPEMEAAMREAMIATNPQLP